MDYLKAGLQIGAYSLAAVVGGSLGVDAYNAVADYTTYNSLGLFAGAGAGLISAGVLSVLAKRGIDQLIP